MYEISSLYHLVVKVDALTQKFEKMNPSVVTPAPVLPPCEVCGVFGHIGVDFQLGSAIESVEQMNYAQYNQGMRQNQKFYKTPQNSYGQMAPPGYANNQRIPQKSCLELLMESYLMNQSKQLQELKNQTGFLNDSLSKLTSKVHSIVIHTKMLETQISQVAQQVAASSQTPRVFPGQTEANPKAHINAISLRSGEQLEDTVAKANNIERERERESVCVKLQGEKSIGENEKPFDKPKSLSH